jgi:GNAT superfamily N-acetyltransferase
MIPRLGKTEIRVAGSADIEHVARLVADVFGRDVAPGYKTEGVEEFNRYATSLGMAARMHEGHVILVAEDGPRKVVGMVEVRDFSHISMLFVTGSMQRRGIGRELVTRAVEMCRERNPGASTITVNASPNSVNAYEHFGFRSSGGEQERNGIRFVPMALATRA